MPSRASLPFALLAALACLGASRVAAAQDARAQADDTPTTESVPPPAPSPPPAVVFPAATETESRWYGWQTLIVDGGAIVAGIATRQALVSLVGYAFGGPVVHWAHGRVGAGLGSLALRVALPIAAGYVGYLIDASSCKPDEWFCGLGGAVIGGSLGILGAVAVDAAVIAREDVARERPAASAGPSLQPYLRVTKEGGAGGLGGVF